MSDRSPASDPRAFRSKPPTRGGADANDPRLAMLEAMPYGERLERVRRDPLLQSSPFAETLLTRARTLRLAAPRRAFETATLALTLTDHLNASTNGAARDASQRIDLAGRSWIALGEAWRLLGDLAAADQALDAARELLLTGSGDLGPAAELTTALAGLRRESGRLDEALELADLALGLRRALGEGESFARLDRIATLRLLRRLDLARHGLEALSGREDGSPRLMIETGLMKAQITAELEDRPAAERALARVAQRIDEKGTGLDRLRWAWLRGRLVGQDEPAQTERLLRQCLRGFTRLGLARTAARVRLDLTLLRCRPRATPSLYLALEARTASTSPVLSALASRRRHPA